MAEPRAVPPSTWDKPAGFSVVGGADDEALFAAIEAYQRLLDAGQPIPPRQFAIGYPKIADSLVAALEGLAAMQTLSSRPSRRPAVEVTSTAEPLGDFRLVAEIGRGGMGVVYEAEQRSLGRRVALKVLPFASALDERQLQRFRNEARAAAQLHHPHIVPVYAVGCERGVHFYAMQLIAGRSLALAMSELQSAADPSHASLIPSQVQNASQRHHVKRAHFRTIARLGIEAASALEHAHQSGIVHRDIKPANLLIDATGRLWITDFGLALFASDPGLTRTGDMVGTLRYMSPEQAAGRMGQVDYRTDVYSLGITLYELLARQPAFQSNDRVSLIRQIDQAVPKPLTSFDNDIPTELITIIGKAIEKEPADRYRTAGEFAEDLQRFLDDVPIRARPPTMFDKGFKWLRRHRSAAIGSATAVCAVAIASFIFAVGMMRMNVRVNKLLDEEKVRNEELVRSRDEAERNRRRSEANFRRAFDVLNSITDASDAMLAERPRGPIADKQRLRLLEEGLRFYSEFIEDHQSDPAVQQELTVARQRMDAIVRELYAAEDFDSLMFESLVLLGQNVQRAVRLSDEQIASLGQSLPSPPWQPMLQAREESATSEDRLQILKKQTARIEEVLTRILSVDQRSRLKQIAQYSRGPSSMLIPKTREALGLEPEQVADLEKLERQTPMRPLQGQDDRKFEALMDQAESVLTESQLAIWHGMVGEPVPRDPFTFGPIRSEPPRGTESGAPSGRANGANSATANGSNSPPAADR
jgi:eukaryotic-like serine/threonine-protein kinase